MIFLRDPVPGTFKGRLTRFSAEVLAGGRVEKAYIPNSGRLGELLKPGAPVFLEPAAAGRLTSYDLKAVDAKGGWVCIDARVPNLLLADALRRDILPELRPWDSFRGEVPLGGSRLDFALYRGGTVVGYIEAKSCTLVEGDLALFPDAPTKRGARHLKELADAAAAGLRAEVVFVVQRSDARRFVPNDRTDPHFGRALREALRAGVRVSAYSCLVEPPEITLYKKIKCECE